MKEKKHKILYWVFKVLSVLISCALPIWAIYERFPMWTETYGTGRSIGTGAILVIIVVLIIFRKSVFDYIVEKLKLNHAPPLVVWLGLLAVSYILVYIAEFMRDLNTVLWMGLIGCAIGTVLTYIAEHCFRKKVEKDE